MKNGINNKALFITALGFYFGLMLTGAAPSTFARQVAVPRGFDIRDEIDFSDDLDKSPDAGKTIDDFAAALLELYRLALEQNPGAIEESAFDFKLFLNINERGRGRAAYSGGHNHGGFICSGRMAKWLFRLSDFTLPGSKIWKENYRIDFELGQRDVPPQSSPFTDNANIAESSTQRYGEALSRRREIEADALKPLIYSTFNIFVEDAHVAIVTRLPRGSIDPLIFTHTP